MDELLKLVKDSVSQLQGSMNTLVNAINYAHNVEKEAQGKLAAANKVSDELETRTRVLKEKEERIEKIENLLSREKELREIEKKNLFESDRIANERAAFEGAKEKALKDLNQRMSKLIDDNVLLDRGWKELRAKEASYKDEIEKSIMARFK